MGVGAAKQTVVDPPLAMTKQKSDFEIVLNAVLHGDVYDTQSYVNNTNGDLTNNAKVILEVIEHTKLEYAVNYASESLRNNKEFSIAAVRLNGACLRALSRNMRDDVDVVLAAVKENGLSLRYASADRRNDKKIALAAIARDGASFRYISPELHNDKDLILAAIKNHASYYIPQGHLVDKEILLAMLSNNKHFHYENVHNKSTLIVDPDSIAKKEDDMELAQYSITNGLLSQPGRKLIRNILVKNITFKFS